jgi:hypothetical protein
MEREWKNVNSSLASKQGGKTKTNDHCQRQDGEEEEKKMPNHLDFGSIRQKKP